MFEELFEKVSFAVVHKLAPYALERQQFLEHCREQGFAKTCLQQMAVILLSAAIDLQAHGGLHADPAQLEAAATRMETVRSQVGLGRGAHYGAPFCASRSGGCCSSDTSGGLVLGNRMPR